MNLTEEVLKEVLAERLSQVAQWGTEIDMLVDASCVVDDRIGYAALNDYLKSKISILGEEFGEICKARNERDWDNLRTECIQTAAVAVAMIEGVDWFNQYQKGLE